jgi:hypothetical protein
MEISFFQMGKWSLAAISAPRAAVPQTCSSPLKRTPALRQASGPGLEDHLTEPFCEAPSSDVLTEHLPALDASDDDVMNGAGSVYSCFPTHA